MPSPAAKKRRVRKGTRSCWECKRRKVRCTYFAALAHVRSNDIATQDSPCDGCRSRGTKCIGQDFEEEKTIAELDDEAEEAFAHAHISQERLPGPSAATLLYTETSSPCAAAVAKSPTTLASILSAVWPDEGGIHGLNALTGSAANIHHGVICQPYDKFFASCDRHGIAQVAHMERPVGSEQAHPVTLARRLLLLSKLLQGTDSEVGHYTGSLEKSPQARRTLMENAFAAATRLVTSDDALVSGSLDGIECIMIEAMYLNNAGHLQRAWLANRRAMLMAHMLGLHEALPQTKEPPVLHDDTRERIDPAIMWFRLVATDWYLSMLIGLAADSTWLTLQPSWADSAVIVHFSPLEQLERTMTAVAGRILLRQREACDKDSQMQQLYEDDSMLKAAAKLMPPKWWSLSNAEAESKHCGIRLQQTLSLMNRFAYYQILMRLHLPHMLSASDGSDIDIGESSRTTAAHASRTVLGLYEIFKAHQGTTSTYCRGVDFVVFTACATLCVAHIETRRRQQLARLRGRQGVVDALEHQRPLDRGLIDRIVEAMQGSPFVSTDCTTTTDDIVAQKMATVLEPLLQVEEQVAQDKSWEVRIVDSRYDEQGSEELETIRVKVLGLGTIVLSRQPSQQQQQVQFGSLLPPHVSGIEEWLPELQGVDIALFMGMTEGLLVK